MRESLQKLVDGRYNKADYIKSRERTPLSEYEEVIDKASEIVQAVKSGEIKAYVGYDLLYDIAEHILDEHIGLNDAVRATEKDKTSAFKFISYSGEYPNLCAGRLAFTYKGTQIVSSVHVLRSGGSVQLDPEETTYGEWDVNWEQLGLDFSEEEKTLFLKMVNENVPHGCCGGCL